MDVDGEPAPLEEDDAAAPWATLGELDEAAAALERGEGKGVDVAADDVKVSKVECCCLNGETLVRLF